MFIVYVVDRYVTGSLKDVYEWLESKGVSLKIQYYLSLILPLLVLIFGGRDKRDFPTIIISLVAVALLTYGLTPFFSMVIAWYQLLVDPDEFFNPKKLYSGGHIAWGCVFVSLLYILITKLPVKQDIAGQFLYFAVYNLRLAYLIFISRRENDDWDGRSKKKAPEFAPGLYERIFSGIMPSPTR